MTVKNFEQNCAGCDKPIALKWDNGVILPAGVMLIADWVFHDECWVDPPPVADMSGDDLNEQWPIWEPKP